MQRFHLLFLKFFNGLAKALNDGCRGIARAAQSSGVRSVFWLSVQRGDGENGSRMGVILQALFLLGGAGSRLGKASGVRSRRGVWRVFRRLRGRKAFSGVYWVQGFCAPRPVLRRRACFLQAFLGSLQRVFFSVS